MRDRYECIQEPADTWLIWDLLEDEPAFVEDRLLMALPKAEAHLLCASLNRLHRESSESPVAAAGDPQQDG